MPTDSSFSIHLTGHSLDHKETLDLESRLRKVTIDFLQDSKPGQAFLKNSIEFKPNPDAPLGGFEPIRIPRRYFPGFFPIDRFLLQNDLRTVIDLKQVKIG